jgi:hypothetical protein
VKIPKGNGWQQLRSRCLDSVPTGSSVAFERPIPLHEWRTRGAFRVDSCNRHEIVLETADVDIGSALLSDAEHLLDKAAEHHATLRSWIEDSSWHSPGWSVVTVYYWSFFLGIAVTRLAGHTSWFLNRQAVSEFRTMSSAADQPSAGALNLSLGPYLTATNREVRLCPTRGQLHEAVWKNVGDILEEMFIACDASANPLEYRTLWCFKEARSRMFSPSWPSLVRNAVNYLPGCGYGEVLRKTDINVGKYLKRSYPFGSEEVVSEFEDHVLKIKPGMHPTDDVPLFCRLLLLFTLVIAGMTSSLHAELLERNGLDRRWSIQRDRFLRSRGVLQEHQTWPFAA